MESVNNIFRLSEESEGDSSNAPEITPEPEKKKRGRPRAGADAKNKAEDYYRNYYHEKRKLKITCDRCGCECTKNQYSKHIKSMKCQLAVLKKG